MAEAIFCPTEVEAKDLLELDMLKAIDNLQKYQTERESWRDNIGVLFPEYRGPPVTARKYG
jgi:hypothetical protein